MNLNQKDQSDENIYEASPASILSQSDKDLLRKFCNKVDKLKYSHYPVCDERFPSIVLIKGKCHRYYSENKSPKNFHQRITWI